jgi:hypothetical protein
MSLARIVIEVTDCDHHSIRHLPKAMVYLVDPRLLSGGPPLRAIR